MAAAGRFPTFRPIVGKLGRREVTPDPVLSRRRSARFAEVDQNARELWKKFSEWYGAVFGEGALSEREKCLITLGGAHAVQCPRRITVGQHCYGCTAGSGSSCGSVTVSAPVKRLSIQMEPYPIR